MKTDAPDARIDLFAIDFAQKHIANFPLQYSEALRNLHK